MKGSEGKVMNDLVEGYIGNPAAWERFLSCWNQDILAILDETDSTSLSLTEKEILSQKGQTFDGATEKSINEKAQELGVNLPDSYKHFLLASNGLLQIQLDDIDGKVKPIEEIGYLSEVYPELFSSIYRPELVKALSPTVDYSEDQDSVIFDARYLKRSIVLSDYEGGGIYLLISDIITPEEELAIWYYSDKHPGVFQFTSFAHLMQYSYIKTIVKPEFDYPYGAQWVTGTCAQELGAPKTYFDNER